MTCGDPDDVDEPDEDLSEFVDWTEPVGEDEQPTTDG